MLRERFFRDRPGDLKTEADEPILGDIAPSQEALDRRLFERHMLQDDLDLKPLRADVVDRTGRVLRKAGPYTNVGVSL